MNYSLFLDFEIGDELEQNIGLERFMFYRNFFKFFLK